MIMIVLPLLTRSIISGLFVPFAANMSPRYFDVLTVGMMLLSTSSTGGTSFLGLLIIS